MPDTYQAKLTVTGRDPNDNTLEVYRTAGTDCTELAATYRNQHFWLPTGKNWMTRKWISGEDQNDGFKQCVCVNAGASYVSGCGFNVPVSFDIPASYAIEFSDDASSTPYDVSAMGGARVSLRYRCSVSSFCEFYTFTGEDADSVISGSCPDAVAPDGKVIAVFKVRIDFDSTTYPDKYWLRLGIGAGVSGSGGDSTQSWDITTNVVHDTLDSALAALQGGVSFTRGTSPSISHFPSSGTVYAIT